MYYTIINNNFIHRTKYLNKIIIFTILLIITTTMSCMQKKAEKPKEELRAMETEKECSGFDFRCINWQMKRQQVLDSEKPITPISETEYRVFYTVKVFGYNGTLGYVFDRSDKLVYSTYIIPIESKVLLDKFIADFDKKYGEHRYDKKNKTYYWVIYKRMTVSLGLNLKEDNIIIIYSNLSLDDWANFIIKLYEWEQGKKPQL